MKKGKPDKDGFTIIELMVVVAVIAILAAIAIPNFLGLQMRAKRKVMVEASSSAKGELHHWVEATLRRRRGVIDVNGDGLITANEVHTNIITVPDSWVQAMYAKIGETALSPWNRSKNLFFVGQINPAVHTGQIVLSGFNGGRSIKIIALDIYGTTLYSDSVSVD